MQHQYRGLRMASLIRFSKRVTLKDVAKMAGVSVGMASRVMGGYGSYSEATKQRVSEAADALGYRPNALARSLRLGRSKAIGLVASNIQSYAWTTFIRGFEAAAASHGYQVILGATYDDPATERAYLRGLQERNVDGIIVAPVEENLDLVELLVDSGMPVVLIGADDLSLNAPRINLDNRSFARQATQHLLDLGHRRIGIIAGNLGVPSGRLRLLGYQDALTAAGIEVEGDLIGIANFRFEPAYAATIALLDLDEPPTALLACNEMMAGATLQALKDRGLHIPEQMSIVAFDDPAWTSFHRPGITTVRTPHSEMADLALKILLALLTDPSSEDAKPAEYVLRAELVIRESVVSPRTAMITSP